MKIDKDKVVELLRTSGDLPKIKEIRDLQKRLQKELQKTKPKKSRLSKEKIKIKANQNRSAKQKRLLEVLQREVPQLFILDEHSVEGGLNGIGRQHERQEPKRMLQAQRAAHPGLLGDQFIVCTVERVEQPLEFPYRTIFADLATNGSPDTLIHVLFSRR